MADPYKPTLTLADVSLVDSGTDVADGAVQETAKLRQPVLWLQGVKGAGTSLNVKLQDCFDKGVTWNDVAFVSGAFTQLTADGSQVRVPSRPLGHLMRALRTSVGNGWSYKLVMCANGFP